MAETPKLSAARKAHIVALEAECKKLTNGQLKARIASQGDSAKGLRGKYPLIDRVMLNEGKRHPTKCDDCEDVIARNTDRYGVE